MENTITIKHIKQMKNKIKIFDFDGTLVSTPLPDSGRVEYQKKTGNEWPHKGWWSQADSLDTSIFEIPVVLDVITDYHRVKNEEGVVMVLLTGRLKKLGDHVKKVLDEKELVFDEYHYNYGGSTDVFKLRVLDSLVEKYPNSAFELWDDRIEHLPIFEDWGKRNALDGKITDFQINVVPAGRH